jgi:hypothetical protein
VILVENELLDRGALRDAVHRVWQERDSSPPPPALPSLPDSWPDRYEHLAADHDLAARLFPSAVELVTELWADLNLEEN